MFLSLVIKNILSGLKITLSHNEEKTNLDSLRRVTNKVI